MGLTLVGLSRTPGILAWGFGLLASPAFAATPAETVLEVRVNDQRSKRLLDPWITVELESGLTLSAPALDDGTDPSDRFANDRIYVARLRFEKAGRGMLYLTNGERQPGSDIWADSRAVAAVEGKAVLMELSDPAGRVSDLPARRLSVGSPSTAVRGPDVGPPPGGPAPEGQEEERSPVAREALIRPSFVPIADWVWGAMGGAGLLLLLGLWVKERVQRLGRLVVGRLQRLGDQVEGMARPLGRGRSWPPLP